MKIKKTLSHSFIIIVLTIFLNSCHNKENYNVLIITIDTTRADHIGVYGKANAMTPNIDALAKEGVLYRNAFSPIPITLPAHSSIMTGMVPFTHGVRDNGIFALNDENTTLAEVLSDNGYATAAAIGAFPLTSESGINQGFQFFNDSISYARPKKPNSDNEKVKRGLLFKERKAGQVNSTLIPWLKENQNKPFFSWLHYYDPHFPHNPPPPFNSSFVNDLYQGEIAYSDEKFGKIVELLKKLDIYDNTMIILTSDHGEGLGEHNELTHTSLIYNSTLHVPLIIKYPKQEFRGVEIQQNVALVDIFPTVLKTLKIPFDIDIQGNELPLENSPNEENEIYAETLSSKISRGWGEQRGLISNKYKYIYGPIKELYNINKDPKELNNLIHKESGRADTMKLALQDYIDEHQNGNNNARIEVSDETLETLRGLGYLQVTNSNESNIIHEKLNDSGDAPQKHIKNVSSYYEAKNLLLNGEYIYANRLINSLLQSDPNNLLVLELKIFADMHLKKYSSAEKAILKLPKNSYGVLSKPEKLYFLGKINFELMNLNVSKKYLEESIELDPSIGALFLLSEIALSSKKVNVYQNYLEEMIKINPKDIDLINTLAISYYKNDNIEKTELHFKKAMNLNPFYHNTYYNYAMFLNLEKRYDEAIFNLSKAINIDKHYYKAHLTKIEILLHLGKKELAILAFENFGKVSKNNMYYNKAINLIKQ